MKDYWVEVVETRRHTFWVKARDNDEARGIGVATASSMKYTGGREPLAPTVTHDGYYCGRVYEQDGDGPLGSNHG